MTLEPTFALTPRYSYFVSAVDYQARVQVNGMTLMPNYGSNYPFSFDQQYAEDKAFFSIPSAANPLLDYTKWQNRVQAPLVELYFNLTSFGSQKQLALIFGFEVYQFDARLLIYSDGGKLGDEALMRGDNQFLMEIESLETDLRLYFIHARLSGSASGGSWSFRGVTGYII